MGNIDQETKSDLMEAFLELQEEVETCLSLLVNAQDEDAIHRLFRAIHNIKGNASLLQIRSIIDFSHEIEEVAGALRRKKYAITNSIAEVLLIAMDRLADLHKQELLGKQFDYLHIDKLMLLYHSLAEADESEADGIASKILQFMSAGLVHSDVNLFSGITQSHNPVIHGMPNLAPEEKILDDLGFFQEIGLLLDGQIEAHFGRSIQLFDWAMKMNRISGTLIDEKQLAAAIYLHDIGMNFLPRDLWSRKLDAAEDDLQELKYHPDFGYNYLVRIPGWEEAATIIQQHHEHVNGAGYPNGLKGSEIHHGAKILAILDTFFLLTKGRVDQSLRKSTVRAISAVNARVDTEFEGMWVQCFNHVIRGELKAGMI